MAQCAQSVYSCRRGNLFLLMLVGLTIIAAGAGQMIPNYVTVKQREAEKELKLSIGQMRAGFDLERRVAGVNSPCSATYEALAKDPYNRARLIAHLECLAAHRFLPAMSLKNPVVSGFQWGTETGKLFWEVQVNLLAATQAEGLPSFEAGIGTGTNNSPAPLGWNDNLTGSNASWSLSTDTPSSLSSQWDDYQGQNKMGWLGSNRGYSLRIATGTP